MTELHPFQVQEMGLARPKLARTSSPRVGGGKAQCRKGVPCGDYCIPKGRKCKPSDPANGIDPDWGKAQQRLAVAKAYQQRDKAQSIKAGMKREFEARVQGPGSQQGIRKARRAERDAVNSDNMNVNWNYKAPGDSQTWGQKRSAKWRADAERASKRRQRRGGQAY